jgi:hypothetical protein
MMHGQKNIKLGYMDVDKRTVNSLHVGLLYSCLRVGLAKGCINWVLFCAVMITQQICRTKAPRVFSGTKIPVF